MKKQILSLVLATTMLFTAFTGSAAATMGSVEANTANMGAHTVSSGAMDIDINGRHTLPKDPLAEPILAYVPLDNRPVNVDRVIYEAESAGFKIEMPDPDLYTTRLDGQPLNSNGTRHGDGEKLLAWIKEMDQTTDYFVISMDQLLSGGLVNSRSMHNTTYTREDEIIDTLIELSKENHIYIIDTVVRLAACTLDYDNADINTYNYLREYNRKPREALKGDKLTVENVIKGYDSNEAGRLLPASREYAAEVSYSFQTRERKLHLIDDILTKDIDGNIKYFIGVDDSTPGVTIQTNEINYIKEKLGDRGLIYSGADELGMMAVLSLMIDYYGYDVNAAAVYFGGTEKTSSGSPFDIEMVKDNVEKHLKSTGVNLVAKENADVEIVVLTQPAQPILNSKYITQMIDYLNKNISKGVPTIVINTAPEAYNGNLEYRMVRECEMSMLLSFSSWGTVGNSIGLSLCNGISRYLYLHSTPSSSDEADIAFLKGLIFSYEKDISYLRGGGKVYFNDYLINENGWSASNFYHDEAQAKMVNARLETILKTSDSNVTVNDIIGNMTDTRYFKGLSGECGIIRSIDLSNYSAPFYRSYEIRFDIEVRLSDATLNGFRDTMTISIPYTPKEGQIAYSVNMYYLDKVGKLHKVPCTYNDATGQILFATNQVPSFFTDTLSMDAARAYSLFKDVPASSWYFPYVMYAHEKGLMKGITPSTFEPAAKMSRAMLLSSLYKVAGEPETTYEGVMPGDVVGGWYETFVEWALKNYIASGYGNGYFGPNDPLTREQLANILYRYALHKKLKMPEEMKGSASKYPDGGDITLSMQSGVDWACYMGILNGIGAEKRILPKAVMTRAEGAAALKHFVEAIN